MSDSPTRKRLEDLGPAQVRLLLSNGGWPPMLHNEAVEWLAEKDREAREREENQKTEELRIARAAKDAAVEANDIAKSANALAHKALMATKNANIIAIASAAIAVAAIFVAILK